MFPNNKKTPEVKAEVGVEVKPGRSVNDPKMAENVRQLDKEYNRLKGEYNSGAMTWQEMVENLKAKLDSMLEEAPSKLGGMGNEKGISLDSLEEENG